MHDPEVLVARVRRPPITPNEWRRALQLGDGYKWSGWMRLPGFVDVWHREPGGQDSGSVCSYRRARWHVHHWRPKVIPVSKIRRWLFQPCASCGRRFRYNDSRFGYMSTDKTWHEECQRLNHLESDMEAMTEMVDRLFRSFGIDSADSLKSIVVDTSERRDQFLLWHSTWGRIRRYRELPQDDQWRAPNEHMSGR